MRRLGLAVGGSALALAAIAATRFGGWAVVSVEQVPDHWITGKPLQLAFQIRQHAQNHMEGLKPLVQARSGSRVVTARTWEFDEDGGRGYRSRLVFPEAGDWQVTINTGFGSSKGILLPWRVVDSNAAALPPLSQAERGRRLFAAKGCVSCHVHRSIDIVGQMSGVAPELSDRRFPPEYLAKFLADPTIKPATTRAGQMPNPRLNEREIATLVAFINAERKLSSR